MRLDRSSLFRKTRVVSVLTASALVLASVPVTAGLAPSGATAMSPDRRTSTIVNGQDLYDTDHNPIQAHGGGFLKVGDTHYWVGEDKSDNNSLSSGINMYRSKDLENWTKVGQVLTPDTPDANGNKILAHCKVECPKLLYNAATRKFVLWGHYELPASYSASEVVVATADKVEGPYQITAAGHFRPGAGNTGSTAMGDRVGALVEDWDTSAKSTSTTRHAFRPATADYPPTIKQYNAPSTSNPENLSYVSNDDYGTSMAGNWWEFHLNDIAHDTTLKARAVQMTAFDKSAYNTYAPNYNVAAASYIVRYPTDTQSAVLTADYRIGDPGSQRAALVAPVVSPTLAESSSTTAVLVRPKDVAFITVATNDATIWYTTDGSNPAESANTKRQRFSDGVRISLAGEPGKVTTVKAVAEKDGRVSAVSTTSYQVAADAAAVPVFKPVVNRGSGTYLGFGYKELRVYSPTYGAEVYFTVDGKDPEPVKKGENLGFGSRDFTVYQDERTGDAYLVTAQDHIYMRVWRLTADFTNVVPDKEYDMYVGGHREAPALIRNGGASGKYVYMITSSQSGWYPNQAQYGRAESLDAGFGLPRDEHGYRNGQSIWSRLQPVGDNTTYGSQPTKILNIGTDANPQYVYVGDRWRPEMLFKSSYVWLPLTISDRADGQLKLQYTPVLDLDVAHRRINNPSWDLLSLNKPVQATRQTRTVMGGPAGGIEDWETTPEQEAAGMYRHYNAGQANDGKDWDLDIYDNVEQYYKSDAMPFHWQVDLGKRYPLSWIGISFKTVGGSDNVHRYTVTASVDGRHWTEVADNTQNIRVGYQSHLITGNYRYVRVNVYKSFDLAHNKDADWARGIYEVSVYGCLHRC